MNRVYGKTKYRFENETSQILSFALRRRKIPLLIKEICKNLKARNSIKFSSRLTRNNQCTYNDITNTWKRLKRIYSPIFITHRPVGKPSLIRPIQYPHTPVFFPPPPFFPSSINPGSKILWRRINGNDWRGSGAVHR